MESAPERRRLLDVSEDELLASIFPYFAGGPATLVGPGDDGAVVATPSGSVVATTDAMTRGRDWLDQWSSASDVAVKCLTQNLADVAAMGAVPTVVLLTLLADPQTELRWVLELARSLGDAAASGGVSVAGGDLSAALAGSITVSITALGDLHGHLPVLRSGARPGDVLALCGTLGHSGAGLHLLRRGIPAGLDAPQEELAAACLQHHRRPVAPLAAGPAAAQAGATAMLDISDGLLRDGSRLARCSGVRLDIEGDRLGEQIAALAEVVGEAARDCVLAGGEEHSLLATFPPGSVPAHWQILGGVTEGEGTTLDGAAVDARGWDHFASQG